MKTCLFLGYNYKKTSLIEFLRKKNISVVEYQNKTLSYKIAKKFDFIISFGYRKIVPRQVIKKLKRPIINLHISYLPYNRGAHPNFWSFVNNTPKGVTIHEVDKGIDSGKIIYRKKLNLRVTKLSTFKSTYKILIKAIEGLFKKNYKAIINKKYRPKKQLMLTKLNLKRDLKKIPNWNQTIKNFFFTHKT